MLGIGLAILMRDTVKLAALLFALTFTTLVLAVSQSLYAGMLGRTCALIDDTPQADVWVTDPAVESIEQTINMPSTALDRIRGIPGIAWAQPLLLSELKARLPSGKFCPVQLVGIDDATLIGLPPVAPPNSPTALHNNDTVAVNLAGAQARLLVPEDANAHWARGRKLIEAPTRPANIGDELFINDHRLVIGALCQAGPRLSTTPVVYATRTLLQRVIPPERNTLTMILVHTLPGVDTRALCQYITSATGLKARTSAEYRREVIGFQIRTSEETETLATATGATTLLGAVVTGLMFFLFTKDNAPHYRVLMCLGLGKLRLAAIVLTQALVLGGLAYGLGLGLTALASSLVDDDVPFALVWFIPVAVGAVMLLVCSLAALLSVRYALSLDPKNVLTGAPQ